MGSKLRKYWKRLLVAVLGIPLLLFVALLAYVWVNQQPLIQSQVDALNMQHAGHFTVKAAHLKPFENFPYLSIKVDSVQVREGKAADAPLIVDVADIYVGFNLWDVVKGNYDIQMLKLDDGFLNIVLHEDGSNNLQNALATIEEEVASEPIKIHLKNIEVNNLDIHKLDESTHSDVEAFIYSGKGGFKSGPRQIEGHIDTDFLLNVMQDGDTTYVHHKHFKLNTDVHFNEDTKLLTVRPSNLHMEHGDFNVVGSVDFKNDVTLDLNIEGTKPNFDLFMAFAPEEVIPILERYENAGDIYFKAKINGPTLHEQIPFVDAEFGASNAFLENKDELKRMSDLGFKGHFTTGEERKLSSMEFSLSDMSATLERGKFNGSVLVRNFEQPEVDMEVTTDFNLDFLARFLNMKDEVTAAGNVTMDMKFHDIIDLSQPERALSELNQAYFAELKVENLSLNSNELPTRLDRLDAHLVMNGKEAELRYLRAKMGASDISIQGFLSDLPAIVHHTNTPVVTHLEIESKVLDLAELTGYSKVDSMGVDERIEDLSLGFSFKSSARAFTESLYLPVGEFFVDSLHAQLKHYPHELHDFHVDILIDEEDLNIVDFTGYVDESDFHLGGAIHDYGFWLQETLDGDVNLDLTLGSDLMRLENLFTYEGENYVPEDYRHEELEKLTLHVNSSMHYIDHGLQSIDVDLDRFDAKMHVHPLRFEDFRGHFHYEDDLLKIENMHGKMGQTVFDASLNYYLGEETTAQKHDNYLGLKANYIDFDELSNFNLSPPQEKKTTAVAVSSTADVPEHAEAFNLYELPFSNMKMDLDVGHFIYHRIDLQNIYGILRTTDDHYIYVDTLRMQAAGGSIRMSGYFNGSDPKNIYLKPDLILENVNIDRLLFKFENFGQDYVVSENLHGQISTSINGLIRIYPDFVPDLDQSEVHMDLQVLNGRLENYEPMLLLSDYMGSKDLTNIRFDTLQNHIDMTKGILTIPAMTIESTLGHMEISGSQSMTDSIEYYFRIPWKTVSQATRSKLFGKGKEGDSEPDEIIEVDPNEKVRYLNLQLSGTTEDFKIAVKKKR